MLTVFLYRTALPQGIKQNNKIYAGLTLNDIDFSEAQRLLGQRLICEDIEDWHADKQQPDTWSCSAGLIREDGVSAKMEVELIHRRSPKTGILVRKMGVFLQHSWGLERVYQLELRHGRKLIKDVHSLSHEHFGNIRTVGNPDWSDWTFVDAMNHFCKQTQIDFVPAVNDPEAFVLKG